MLKVEDYTKAVAPLISHLDNKFPEGLVVSDIRDTLGKQYVDLVQEGGGVHGIALAGYTYVLEKMGISFMKMAGTSAGSINTLLLNAVNTEGEAKLLALEGKYYETRSEKVLEYLSDIDLRDFIDGPDAWKNLILGLFTPAFKQKGIRGFVKQYKQLVYFNLAFLILIIAGGFFLGYYTAPDNWRTAALWVFRLSFVGFILVSGFLFLKAKYTGRLYKLIERFGVNPGQKFEDWINSILKENNVATVEALTLKFEKEKEVLNPSYVEKENTAPLPAYLSAYQSVFNEIENPDVRVELLYIQLCNIIHGHRLSEKEMMPFRQQMIKSFERRLSKDSVVTKEIVIVSSDITHGLKVEFPGMHKMYWGNDTSISPARYVRASMAVPVFFRPMEVTFDEKQKQEIGKAWSEILKVNNRTNDRALFVDGGLLSNFPINVFYNATMPVPRKPTFGIKLEYENEIDSRTIKNLMQFGGSMLNTMRFFYDRDFALKQDIFKKTVRSIDTGKVHWLNFNLSDREKLELFFRGRLAATVFLSHHTNTTSDKSALKALGKNVPIGDTTFSIYGENGEDFKIEDWMIEHIAFEWQSYKLERLMDRLSKEVRKDQIKGCASLSKLK